MLPNILTYSRILFSLLLLVFPPHAPFFTIFYLLCGVTDVLDGFAARKLHTESEKGARLDSAADLVFAAVYAARILPQLAIPPWIWLWTAVIAAAKVTGLMIAGIKTHAFRIEHSPGNQLTGLLLFLLPLSAQIADAKYGAALVCIAASVTAMHEIYGAVRKKRR